jgi:hypothetical protein
MPVSTPLPQLQLNPTYSLSYSIAFAFLQHALVAVARPSATSPVFDKKKAMDRLKFAPDFKPYPV